jgi:hypothetical protein
VLRNFDSFDRIDVVSPIDGAIIPAYNVKPQFLTAVQNVDVHDPDITRVYNGFELGFNARPGRGARIFGAFNLERTLSNTCSAGTDPNFTVFCNQAENGLPWLKQFKVAGTYPLPYLKLMEIYRRKGDEDSYERTRDRFNQRFNAVAPSWGAVTPQDRHLEDLPDVLRRIQQVWPRPVDAMALLENMLVRTEGGTLLEMSALGEVLFLFTLARDLHEQEEGAAGPVDVLLPLDDMFGYAPAQAGKADSGPATQFSASAFAKLAAPAAALAGLSGAAAASSASLGEDHFDLPLGEPMFEPVFDAPASVVGTESAGTAEPAAFQLSLPDSIDLPLTDESPARGAAAPAEDSFLEPLSFDLPELEAIQAPLPSKAAAPVDVDFSLDGLELEPVSPKLSQGEEQAASNFGLFHDAPATGKPR